jgi:hypothetical protein
VMAGASPFYRGRKKAGARGFNGRRSMPGLEDTSYLEKISVTQSEEGGGEIQGRVKAADR